MSAVFAAKYDGVCGQCNFSFEAKEMVHYVNGKVCHETCHASDGSDFNEAEQDWDRDTAGRIERRGYMRQGRRPQNPPVCKDCSLEHPVGTECL